MASFSTAPTLHYFPILGRGEPIRMTFALCGVPYEEQPVDFGKMKAEAGTALLCSLSPAPASPPARAPRRCSRLDDDRGCAPSTAVAYAALDYYGGQPGVYIDLEDNCHPTLRVDWQNAFDAARALDRNRGWHFCLLYTSPSPRD